MSIEDYYKEKEEYSKVGGGRLRNVLKLLPQRLGRFLDLGCGEGVFLKEIQKVKDVDSSEGVELSQELADKAKRYFDVVHVHSLEEHVWKNSLEGVFNTVLISEVLEHLFHPEEVLQSLEKYISKESDVIITVPNILFWKNRLKIFFGSFRYENKGIMDRGHIHFFTWDTLQELCREAGYEIVETSHFFPNKIFRPFSSFFPGLFAFQFIIRIQKS